MKSIIIVACILLALSGCSSTAPLVKPEVQVVVQTKYVVRVPPKELLTIPPQVPDLEIDKAQQSDVAQWLIAKEMRVKTLEDQLIGIGTFFQAQETQLNAHAATENQKANDAGVAAFAGEAKAADAKSVDAAAAENMKALKK